MTTDTEKTRTKKIKKNKKIVSFEQEVVNKEKASELLSNLPEPEPVSEPIIESIKRPDRISKKQKRKLKDLDSQKKSDNENINEEIDKSNGTSVQKASKKKKRKIQEIVDDSTDLKDSEEVIDESSKNPINSEQSKRAKKKQKHIEQLAAKKLKATLATQENVLNYLSKWKYSRNEWKFEKLKQIWLSQNLFDSAKLPEEFWDTAVDYFSQSRGFIRKLILREALKIVEEEDKSEEDNTDEEYINKIKRARSIVQSLQD